MIFLSLFFSILLLQFWALNYAHRKKKWRQITLKLVQKNKLLFIERNWKSFRFNYNLFLWTNIRIILFPCVNKIKMHFFISTHEKEFPLNVADSCQKVFGNEKRSEQREARRAEGNMWMWNKINVLVVGLICNVFKFSSVVKYLRFFRFKRNNRKYAFYHHF